MATHSSVLAWKIPGKGEPGGLPSMGSHRVGHDWSNLAAAAAYITLIILTIFKCFFIHTKMHSALAWKIPWMEEPGGLQSMGSQSVRHDWVTSLSLFTFMHWRRKWQPISGVLAWRIPGKGEPGGLPSMGSHRGRHDWCALAVADSFKQKKNSQDSFSRFFSILK